jgi:hypothetical protein
VPTYPIQDILLAHLYLDAENPRHDVVTSQVAAMRTMLSHDDRAEAEIVRIADHIISDGLNPGEQAWVMKLEGTDNDFVVLEGNRRLTALKLLDEPERLPSTVKSSTKKRINELSEAFHLDPIESITCVVFPNREEANRWIRLKHTGENGGVGTVQWNAIDVARFNERFGTTSPSLQAINFVREHGGLSDEDLARLPRLPITNLDRLLNTPAVRERLGVEFVDGGLHTRLPHDQVVKGLTRVVRDIARRDIKVGDIRSRDQREDYATRVANEEKIEYSGAESKARALGSDGGGQTGTATKAKRVRPVSTARKTVVPPSFALSIADDRVNRIFRELRQLKVDQFPNAAAVLLRVFLELSVDRYIDAAGLAVDQRSKLRIKIEAVSDHMESVGLLSRDQLKPVRTAASDKNRPFSVDTLHAYVHNPLMTPKADTLKQTWDEMQLFADALWR